MAHLGKIIFGSLWFAFGMFILIGLVAFLVVPLPEPSIPQELPREVTHANVNMVTPGDSSAVVGLGQQATVQFDAVSSLHGYCAGCNGCLQLNSPATEELSGLCSNASWYGDLTETYNSVNPEMDIILNSQDYLHQWVAGKATMTAIYPVKSGTSYWENEYQDVARTVNLYVVTPEEAQALKEHRDWENNISNRTNAVWIEIPFVLLFFIIPGALLVRYGIQQRKKSSAPPLYRGM